MTFQDYLLANHIQSDSLSETELERLRVDFKKEYARTYQRALRSRIKRIEFVTTSAEKKIIQSLLTGLIILKIKWSFKIKQAKMLLIL